MRARSVLIFLTATGACAPNSPQYFAPAKPLEAGTMMAAAASATVELPLRRPTKQEQMMLQEERKKLGFEVPYLQRKDVDVSIQYTITNLSDMPGEATVAINGANEYTSYDLAAIQMFIDSLVLPPDTDAPPLFPLLQSTKTTIKARATLSGNIREDDVVEAARDLDAIGRFKAPYLTVLINDSSASPLGMEMVPKNVQLPQLWRFIVTFTATVPMRMDFLVRARDQANVLAEGSEPIYKPNPKPFLPMVAGAAPIMP